MPAQKQVVKVSESSALLDFSRQPYTYVQLSESVPISSPNRLCRICDERGPLCLCDHNVGVTAVKETLSPQKHKFAQTLLLLITFFLSVAIVGSALLLRTFKSPTAADHRNPLMMSVFLDNESTSRFEVVDNTVDIIKGRRTKRVLASGTYIRNAEGAGWNHLTVRAGEGFSSSPSNKEYSQETSMNYIRSMEAAGYLEGFATCMEIGQYYVNFYFGLFDGGDPTEGSLQFLEDNYDWMAEEAEKNWETSDYWLAVKGLIAQLNGLLDGLREGCPSFSHTRPQGDTNIDPQHHGGVYLPSLTRNPSLIHLLLLNANGDLYQISDKFSQTDSSPTTDDSDDEVNHPFDPPSAVLTNFKSKSLQVEVEESMYNGNGDGSSGRSSGSGGGIGIGSASRVGKNVKSNKTYVKSDKNRKMQSRRRRGRGGEEETGGSRSAGVDHCSALIKLVTGKGNDIEKNDLIVGHNTWDDFQCAGPRIYKHYSLPLITGFSVPDTFSSGYNAGTVIPEGTEGQGQSDLNSSPQGGEGQGESDTDTKGVEGQSGSDTTDSPKGTEDKAVGVTEGKDNQGPPNGIPIPILHPISLQPTAPSGQDKAKSKRNLFASSDIKLNMKVDNVIEIGSGLGQSQNQGQGQGQGQDDYSDDDNENNNSPDDDDSWNGRSKDRLEMHFSSSPGLLSSVDDFFTLSGRGEFIVLETTMDVYNTELLEYIRPDTILSWTRARLSNQLASTGSEWAEIFSMYHSGTYANQWMVVDLTRFRGGKEPLHGLLTVLEEIPGYMHSADVTSHLIEKGYWGSYNNPYFDDISELSGNAGMCEENTLTCYETDPRANLFRKHQGSVSTIIDMQRIMGLNEYATDILALNDSCNAIACRQDLEPILESRYPFGAIDGKVTSARLLMSAKIFESKSKNAPDGYDVPSSSNPFNNFRSLSSSLLSKLGDIGLSMDRSGSGSISGSDRAGRSDSGRSGSSSASISREKYVKMNNDINMNDNNNKVVRRVDEHDPQGTRPSSFRPPHAYARMGPSNRGDGMPPFCWKAFSRNRDKRGKVFSHAGQPDCFDFNWQAMPPPLRE